MLTPMKHEHLGNLMHFARIQRASFCLSCALRGAHLRGLFITLFRLVVIWYHHRPNDIAICVSSCNANDQSKNLHIVVYAVYATYVYMIKTKNFRFMLNRSNGTQSPLKKIHVSTMKAYAPGHTYKHSYSKCWFFLSIFGVEMLVPVCECVCRMSSASYFISYISLFMMELDLSNMGVDNMISFLFRWYYYHRQWQVCARVRLSFIHN